MRYLLLVLIVCILFSTVYAQNMEVVLSDTVVHGQPGDELAVGGIIINKLTSNLDITITRKTNVLPENWTTSLCLTTCAPSWIDQLSGTIPAGDSTEFSIHFFSSQEPGEGEALLEIKELQGRTFVTQLFKASTINSSVRISEVNNKHFKLLGNYPNPFNNFTIIRFQAGANVRNVTLRIYALTGKLVFEKFVSELSDGMNTILYDGKNTVGDPLPSGIYIYRLFSSLIDGISVSETGKLTLLK